MVYEDVFARLREMGIPFECVEHEEVHTIEDCQGPQEQLHALVPRNAFLTPRNRSAFYLMLIRPETSFRTAVVSKQIGCSRLSFATPEDLARLLRTTPGAVSPMGLLFDEGSEVQLVADERLREEERLAFHPCVPTMTLAMKGSDFWERFLPALHKQVIWVKAFE